MNRDTSGEIRRQRNYEGVAFYMSEPFIKKIREINEWMQIDFQNGKRVDLVMTLALKTSTGRTVGFIEEIIGLDEGFLSNLKKRFDAEVFFFVKPEDGKGPKVKGQPIVASHKEIEEYSVDFFINQLNESKENVFDLAIDGQEFGFRVQELSWGTQSLYMGIGASKQASNQILRNVNYAFVSVVGAIIFLLVILSLVISRILMRPLNELLYTIETMDISKGVGEVDITSDTELGALTESFNDMAKRVNEAQNELHDKIAQLETANQEIKETQSKLVHTAKMASLGQLVAGIAHELNNPIGFIYSNMEHLRDYSKRLTHLIEVAEKRPQELNQEKEKNEFDYIIDDLPKLIKSCEDGAKRTRDIVLGLRNFSRLEEAKLKKINVVDAIDNTLQLLSGELKGRVEILKNIESNIPEIECYPSQLNQVFMNILSNAAQAIVGKGLITIAIAKIGDDRVKVSIKDSGKGIDKKTKDKIFDPFFTTKNPGQGTGLGLSISYGIIEKHGGDIQCLSEAGKGTEFVITLPVASPNS